MNTQNSTRSLFVELSENDKEEMTKNLCDNLVKIDQLADEKKEAARKFKTEIDTLHDHNSNLAKWINDGGREMPVAVDIQNNTPKPGIRTIVRKDTFDSWEEAMEEYTLDTLKHED